MRLTRTLVALAFSRWVAYPVGVIGILSIMGLLWAELRWLALAFLAPGLAAFAGYFRDEDGALRESMGAVSPGLPRGDRPFAELRFAGSYFLSTVLSLLNPWQLAQGAVQLSALIGKWPTEVESRGFYTLPVRGRVFVVSGGRTPATSHSWDIPAQRYAYDFVLVDARGKTHKGEGGRLSDYYAYGAEVVAPADGTVIRTVDGIRDAPRVGTGWIDWLARDIGGNSITIDHGNGEYSYLAHLQPGSVRVRPGDAVSRGQELARVGNSGLSTEPHLHFQLQNDASPLSGFGRAPRFVLRSSTGAEITVLDDLKRGDVLKV